jgi:hypothetical protein
VSHTQLNETPPEVAQAQWLIALSRDADLAAANGRVDQVQARLSEKARHVRAFWTRG